MWVRNIEEAKHSQCRRACMAQHPYRAKTCYGKSNWMITLCGGSGGGTILTVCTPCKDLYVKNAAEEKEAIQ